MTLEYFALAFERIGEIEMGERVATVVPCDPILDRRDIGAYEEAERAGELQILYRGPNRDVAEQKRSRFKQSPGIELGHSEWI